VRGRIIRVTFLTRDGCSLCDEALRKLRVPAELLRVGIEQVDVDGDADLVSRFGDRVPVVLSAGEVVAEGLITRGQAWGAVWRARKG
jgi:hypothetical protein